MKKQPNIEQKKIKCALALVNVLEKEGVKLIFGHPGEQILSFYDALRPSNIKHILTRHEQSAAHAADGYARASGKFGVCVATAGPGALNLIMGIATAYTDSVPILVITGDVPTSQRGTGTFQDIDLCSVFNAVTLKSFYCHDAPEAIENITNAIEILKKGITGPVHVNLPKNILEDMVKLPLPSNSSKNNYLNKIDVLKINKVLKLINSAKKPLIVAGAGLIWGGALKEINELVKTLQIPLSTTYPSRGVIPENNQLCLGLIGNRGTPVSNYAGKNCDLIIGLGCRFSERTLSGIGKTEIIHVNIDPRTLKGDTNIQMDVKEFLNEILKFKELIYSEDDQYMKSWWLELNKYRKKHPAPYDVKFNYCELPLMPKQAIKEILDASGDSIIVNDAGTHTTWVTLYKKVLRPSSLLFSGGFGPMGYGLPAAIGASFANPDESILVIVGDGGFQMTLQELATIHQNKLPIVICVINNHSLGIIRQWQEIYYGKTYEVELENPDFVKLGQSYGIGSTRCDSPESVFNAVEKGIKLKKPFLIDISVQKENIPLPYNIKK
jgi:acetolactate synthase-1/2/3 large subunit